MPPSLGASLLNFLLMNFAVMGKVSVVRWMLRRGADPNAIDRTPVGVRSVDEEGQVVSEEAPRPRLMTVLREG